MNSLLCPKSRRHSLNEIKKRLKKTKRPTEKSPLPSHLLNLAEIGKIRFFLIPERCDRQTGLSKRCRNRPSPRKPATKQRALRGLPSCFAFTMQGMQSFASRPLAAVDHTDQDDRIFVLPMHFRFSSSARPSRRAFWLYSFPIRSWHVPVPRRQDWGGKSSKGAEMQE